MFLCCSLQWNSGQNDFKGKVHSKINTFFCQWKISTMIGHLPKFHLPLHSQTLWNPHISSTKVKKTTTQSLSNLAARQCMRDVKGFSTMFGEGQNGAAQKHMAMKTQAETEKQQAEPTSALN